MLIFVARALPADVLIVKLRPATVAAWDRYYGWADQKISREIADPGRFLIADHLPPRQKAEIEQKVRAGEIVTQRVTGGVVPRNERFEVPEGEIHHVWGSVFIPNVRMPELMRFLQDYDHHAGKFADVERSRLISRNGDNFRIFYRLSRSKAFVTAVYSTEQEASYVTLDSRRVFGRSRATKICELEDPGTPGEKERSAGDDRGFLWRLVSWWRYQETDLGVTIECESASLSRDVPRVVDWIPGVGSYIRSTPLESLRSVLASIRANFARPK